MNNNVNEILVDSNQRMRKMDDSLGNTVNDVHEINNIMGDTRGMLVD